MRRLIKRASGLILGAILLTGCKPFEGGRPGHPDYYTGRGYGSSGTFYNYAVPSTGAVQGYTLGPAPTGSQGGR